MKIQSGERGFLRLAGEGLWLAAWLAAPAAAQVTQRLSAAAGGIQGNWDSGQEGVSVSSDGRFVAFTSRASNLVAGDTNGFMDVFVRDRESGTTERVSVDSSGTQADGDCSYPSISGDGRYVAFTSVADNLVAGDTNGTGDVFVRDRQSGTTERVSVASSGAQANAGSDHASISADGRCVAFQSYATNFYSGDVFGLLNVFVRDRQTSTTELETFGLGGSGEALGGSGGASISADGRFVAFSSFATNLIGGDTNNFCDVFVRDRQSGTVERVSVDSSGAQGNAVSGYDTANGDFFGVSVSSDGRYVAFTSYAGNLVSGDTNAALDVFVRDRQSATTERASVDSSGGQANDLSYSPALSSDGRYVCFTSLATNLVVGDTNATYDVFLRDRSTGTTSRASVSSDGTEANDRSGYALHGDRGSAAISSDGHSIGFVSDASSLGNGADTNGWSDVYVRDLQYGTTERVSLTTGGEGNADSDRVAMSPDGRYVAFDSAASDLVPGDTNGAPDVFVLDNVAGTLERVSVSSSGAQAAGECEHPAISTDGRFVAFDSYAGNLVAGSTSGRSDIYLRDRQAGTTEVVSISTGGARGDADSFRPSISSDGRFVAFESNSANLVAGDTNGVNDVFVGDRQLGTTERVSVSSAGTQGDQYSYIASISADGRYVAFQSFADNLVTGDTNGQMDVFVRDRQLATTVRASVSSGGVQGNSQSGTPSISANGRYVAFTSSASNLVAGDTNGTFDVFVRDLQGGITSLASADSGGAIGNGQSLLPTISSDGRFVAFYSEATNLVAGDVNGFGDIFLRDRLVGATSLASVSTGGVQGNSNAGNGTADAATSPVSAEGRFIVFVSAASNLVAGDTNGAVDVFLRDRGTAAAFTAFCFGDGTGAACPCANSGAPGHGCENSATTGGAVLSGSGVASLAADTAHLLATGEKPTATSVLLQGNATVSSLHYGDGLRCVGGTLKRLYSHNAVGGAVSMPQGADLAISVRSAAAGDVIQAGSTRSYQIYYRDPSTTFCPSPNGSTFNISNAIAIAWGE
jgi:Tol biopolymer transport system component